MNSLCKIMGVLGILLAPGWKCFGQAVLPENFSVATPDIPDHLFKITNYGAVGDGKTFDTHAVQNAIDACKRAGGGTVDIPPGVYLVSPLVLASNLNLHLEAGSTIRLSSDPDDYQLVDDQYQSAITLKDGHDIAITGSGTIDGQGAIFWRDFVPPKTDDAALWDDMARRPKLIQLTRCSRVLIQGVTLTNSPMFHLVPTECQDVTIRGVHIKAPAVSPNTDGIDPSGRNILIADCTIDTGDDCIAVKAGDRYDPKLPSCENILVENCHFLHGHGMSIGSETKGGLRNMVVRNCSFDGTEAGIRIKSARGRGGMVEDVTYENLTMHNVKNSILITSYYPRIPAHPDKDPAHAVTDLTPMVRHIRISDVTSTDGLITGQIVGLPEMPLEDIVLTRVQISARKPLEIFHANDVQFVNCQIASAVGSPVIMDSTVQGLAGVTPEGNK